MRLDSSYFFQQLQWIKSDCNVPQQFLGGSRDVLCLQEPLAWSLWRMITLCHKRAVSAFLRQLERRLEEVHEQPGCLIEAGNRPRRGKPLKSLVAKKLSYDCAVLLLDRRLVVFPIRP